MDSEKRIAHCRFLIGRFDEYMGGVNSKVAFYLSINTFILGGICVGYITCKNCLHTNTYWLLLGFTILVLLCCLGSIFFTIKAVSPYLKDNQTNDDRKSLIYFGGIAKHTCADFSEKFNIQSEDEINIDLVRQVHSMACGLDRKFRNINRASVLLTIEYFILIISLILSFSILN